jgi:HAMP domain-containing protein
MRLTIGRKLGIGFGIPLVLLILIGFGVLTGFTALTNATRDSIEAQQTIEFMERGMRLLLTERILLSRQFATGEETIAAEVREDYMQEWSNVVENASAEYSGLVVEIQNSVTIYHQYLEKAQVSFETNPDDVTNAIFQLNEADIFFIQIVEPAMGDLLAAAEVEKNQLAGFMEDQIADIMRIAIVVVIIGSIVGIFSALTISRGITRAALYLSSAAESISRGDLDTPIVAETGDEMEDLARSIERMRTSLKAAIERLRRKT